MKHTPGPWKVKPGTDGFVLVRAENAKEDFQNVHYWETTPMTFEERKANAKIIAEAPAMKDMLLTAMSVIIKHGHDQMITEYNELIKKITG